MINKHYYFLKNTMQKKSAYVVMKLFKNCWAFFFFLNNSAVVKLFVLLTTIILWRLHYSYEKHLGSIENKVNDDSGVGGNGWVERTGPLAFLSLFSVNC